jgi:hydrogenase maturation protease
MSAGKSTHTLVAGVGNIFRGDDAFGVEVARRLAGEQLPDGVLVTDYGIRGMHLAYDLAGMAPRTTILVDATPRGGPAGTVYVLELEPEHLPAPDPAAVDSHGMQPEAVLSLLAALGGSAGRVLVVGCEPAVTGEHIGLSPAVAAAVGKAVETIKDLVRDGARTRGR